MRLGIGAAALGLLIHFGRLDLGVLAAAFGRPDLLAGAALLLVGLVPLATFRWWVLLRGLGFTMSYGWTLRTLLVGLFCNTFLPGSYGGDIVRVGLAYRAAGRNLSRVTFTVLVDRLSGLFALSIIGFTMLPYLAVDVFDVRYVIPLVLFVVLILGAGLFALLFGERTIAMLSRLPTNAMAKLTYVAGEVVAALRAYVDRWYLLVCIGLLSIVMFIMLLTALALLGFAMHFDALGIPGYFAAGGWATLANAIPLTPGGIGIGEAAFAQIAHLLEPTPTSASYATAFLAMRMLNVLISVAGILPYSTQRREVSEVVERATNEPDETDSRLPGMDEA